MVAYPPSLTACVYDDYTFGVWQHTEESLPLNTQSVLYSVINLSRRLPTSSFTAEPAIATLDWTFTPIPNSSERFADQQRFDPPPSFHRASIWSGIDRVASGPPPLTPSEHTSSLTVNCCGHVGFPSASEINSLTSPMIKTPWGIFRNAR